MITKRGLVLRGNCFCEKYKYNILGPELLAIRNINIGTALLLKAIIN